jgi:zinc-binding alcohol dehydrogenase/oxidoreductase
MKAAVLKKTGDSIKQNIVIEDIPQPEITSDEDVIIKLKSASLNHRDLWIAKGLYSKIQLPAVLGSDGSGIVFKKGKGVKEFKESDEVIINPNINWVDNENYQGRDYKILGMPSQGTFAEYIKVNRDRLILKPPHLSFQEAASIPVCGLTAFRALFRKGELRKDENILITGTGGGVAGFILLFAVNTGANVFVTSGSNDKIEKAIQLGAAAGINYAINDWEKKLLESSNVNFDLIIDGSGGDTINKCLELVKYGGKIISYGATLGKVNQFNIHRVFWKQISLMGSTMGSNDDFKEMIEYIENEKIVPVIDSVFELENITEAFEKLSGGDHFGKIVVRIG